MLTAYLIFCTLVLLLSIHVVVTDNLLFRQAGYAPDPTPKTLIAIALILAAFIPGVNLIHLIMMVLYIRGYL